MADSAEQQTPPTYAELAAKLSPRHRRLLEEYTVDWNGGAAAKRAGFKGKNNASLRVTASNALARPDVRAALSAWLDEIGDSAQLQVGAILNEVKAIAYSNIHRVATVTPHSIRLKSGKSLDPEDAKAIQSVSMGRHGPALKMHDKLHALELLGRYRKMFTDRHEHTGKDGGPIQVRDTTLDDLTDDELRARAKALLETEAS